MLAHSTKHMKFMNSKSSPPFFCSLGHAFKEKPYSQNSFWKVINVLICIVGKNFKTVWHMVFLEIRCMWKILHSQILSSFFKIYLTFSKTAIK